MIRRASVKRSQGPVSRHASGARLWVLRCAGAWLVSCVVFAACADLFTGPDHDRIDLLARLMPPLGFGGTLDHPLGTDELGRDVLARLMHALRTSFLLALAGTVIGAVLGAGLGLLAAWLRGAVDDGVAMLIDLQAAIPFFVIALTVIAIFGSSLSLFVVLLGLYGWERYARLARAAALSASGRGYVEALHALGAGPMRIYGRHVLPNIASTLIVAATLNFPETILLESALSFLGLGVQFPHTSLGAMLGDGRDYLMSAWWIAVAPGVVIFLCTLSMALIGDWLRDYLDPTLR